MNHIHITKLPVICDYKIEVFVTSKDNTELEALKEAFKQIGRSIIWYETHSH